MFLILGRNNVIVIILIICSIKLDSMYGNMFCFPQKYPVRIEEIDINGMVMDIHIIGKYSLSSLNRFTDIKFDVEIIKNIIIKFINIDIGMIDVKRSFVL